MGDFSIAVIDPKGRTMSMTLDDEHVDWDVGLDEVYTEETVSLGIPILGDSWLYNSKNHKVTVVIETSGTTIDFDAIATVHSEVGLLSLRGDMELEDRETLSDGVRV